MYLEGQASQRGYAMAAVLIGIALLSVVAMALLPAWRQQGKREKEAELAFRGEQYARAIYLFQRKNPGINPPSIDVLVQGKYLRKKFKDPITNEDFVPLFVGQQPQTPGQPGGPGRGGPTGPGRGNPAGGFTPPPGQSTPSIPGGSILGVSSKSTEASIRVYYGAGYYNQWRFQYRGRGRGNPQQQPGTGDGRGRGTPGSDRPGIRAPGSGGPSPGLPGGGPGRGGPGRGGPGRGGPGRGGPGRGGPIVVPGPGGGRGPR